ncbi:two-component regulator propeller domain-containing protein [Paludibacter sp.]
MNIRDGLSHQSITSLYQDEFGFIWIGTRDGLNRYDGSQTRIFYKTTDNQENFSGSVIQSICGNGDGLVYALTKDRVFCYDAKEETLTRIGEQEFSHISYGTYGLLAISNNKIYQYDETEKAFKLFVEIEDTSIVPRGILQSSIGLIYVNSQNKGLFLIDKNKKYTNYFPTEDIVKVFENAKGFLWLGLRRNGMLQVDKSGKIIKSYKHDDSQETSLLSNYVRDIVEDKQGNIWIGTQYGLDKLNTTENTITHFKHTHGDVYGISNSSIFALLCDKQGNIWVGSYYGGVDYFNPDLSFYQFNKYYDKFATTIFNEILEDTQKNLWIINGGGGGLYYYDRTNNVSVRKLLYEGLIKTIYLDDQNNTLWVGSIGNCLYKMNTKQGTTVKYRNILNQPSLESVQINRIIPYKDMLYLATGKGLISMNIKEQKFTEILIPDSILDDKFVNDMVLDAENNLWFCTFNKLFTYNIETQIITTILDNEAKLFTLYIDKEGTIWCGTSDKGLAKIDKDGQVSFFSIKNSNLNSNGIIDINESLGGYLVLATKKGLSWMNRQTNSFNNFDYNVFSPLLQINENGLMITSDGTFFLSGINGLYEFKESDVLNKVSFSFPILFTELYVNNKLISPSTENGIISTSLLYENKIKLKHYHTSFTINFTSLDYTSPEENIEYKLEGFDREWIKASNERKIMYSNLLPGNYKLIIRNSRTAVEQAIQIEMLTPFYKTWLAYIVYSIIALIILYLILSNYISRIKLQTSLVYANREKEQIEELNQAKLLFFTNISHEFRTPLTLIIGHIEMLLQNSYTQQSSYPKLMKILSNAHRMQRLISELIEFRKQEQGILKLNVEEHNIAQFLDEICNSFKEYSLFSKINLIYLQREENLMVWFDANQMEKVFYNLLSNAFKNTPSSGRITVELFSLPNKVVIKVTDTGHGIDEDSINKIFDRFYQIDHGLRQAEIGTGSGIGLSLAKNIINAHSGNIYVASEVGKGSSFTVELNLGDSHFTEEQKAKEPHKNEIQLYTTPILDTSFVDKIIETQKQNDTFKSTILIVEDNVDVLKMLCSLFEPFYKVLSAINGEEGLKTANKTQPDIILSDVFMPKMSGIEMCTQLKSNIDTCHIPIVLLTARSASEYIIQGFEQGADDYIMKPFDSKLLITRCNNLVNNRKHIQKHFLTDLTNDSKALTNSTLDRIFIENAIRIIEENCNNPEFTVVFLAKELALSKSALYTKLKGITGETVNDFILNIRLKKSVFDLLENTKLTVAEIAYKYGFEYPSYYIKRFKKIFGETPSQYRKNKIS